MYVYDIKLVMTNEVYITFIKQLHELTIAQAYKNIAPVHVCHYMPRIYYDRNKCILFLRNGDGHILTRIT